MYCLLKSFIKSFEMFGICLKAFNRNTLLAQISGNSWVRNREFVSFLLANGSNRLVHSTNTHEIDYLLNKYKLSVKSDGGQSYGQKSLLHNFNTIDDNFNFEPQKSTTVDTLRQVLGLRKSDAILLVKNYPNLVEMSTEGLEKQVQCLSEWFGMTLDHFWSCPWTLYLPLNFINERLKTFGRRVVSSDHLVLLLIRMKLFEQVVKKMKKNNYRKDIYEEFHKKRNLFTTNLDITEEEFCDLVHENGFLFSYHFERLETVMNLLKRADIDSDLIMTDIRVFTQNNIDGMKERVDKCLKHKMPVKTWMLRSTEDSFNVCLRRHVDNKKVLKDYDNNISYMANQLKCDTNVIYSMMKRYPRIVQLSSKKLFEKLSFLFANGFSTYHIIETPKVLFHSVDTILQRVQQLETINMQPKSLKIYTLSEKEYQKLFHQLKIYKESGSESESESDSK